VIVEEGPDGIPLVLVSKVLEEFLSVGRSPQGTWALGRVSNDVAVDLKGDGWGNSFPDEAHGLYLALSNRVELGSGLISCAVIACVGAPETTKLGGCIKFHEHRKNRPNLMRPS
jgi:hypothetical protein